MCLISCLWYFGNGRDLTYHKRLPLLRLNPPLLDHHVNPIVTREGTGRQTKCIPQADVQIGGDMAVTKAFSGSATDAK
jgi:hypothetical protein